MIHAAGSNAEPLDALYATALQAARDFAGEVRQLGGLVRNGTAATTIRRRRAATIDVLIVDDDPEWHMIIAMNLEHAGFRPKTRVASCRETMEAALLLAAPQAILCDHTMPDFSSADALMLARRLAPLAPFVIVSGTMPERDAAAAIEMGATDWIRKDELARLGPVLRRELGRRG